MSFDADKKAAELIGVMGMVDQVCASDIAWLVAWVKGIHAAGLEAGRKEENEACAQEIRSYIFEKGLSDELLDIAAFIESRVPDCDQYHCGHPKCNERKEKQKQTAGFA